MRPQDYDATHQRAHEDARSYSRADLALEISAAQDSIKRLGDYLQGLMERRLDRAGRDRAMASMALSTYRLCTLQAEAGCRAGS